MTQPSDDQRKALLADVDRFFATGAGTMLDFDQLRRYVIARPVMAPTMPVLAAHEADERLRIAGVFLAWQGREIPKADLPKIILALCVSAPLHRLQWMEKEVQHDGLLGMSTFTNLVTGAVRTYLQRPASQAVDNMGAASRAVHRSQIEKAICLDRDRNRCILTGTPNPEVCHIVPFAANNSEYKIRGLWSNMAAFKTLLDNPAILTSSPGCTDKAWNMLSLTPSLHSWWARGHFAFRCLGVTPAVGDQGTVDLQLHWMPRPLQDHSTQPKSLRPWEDEVPQEHHRAWIQAWGEQPCYGASLDFDDKTPNDADAVLAVPHPVTSRLLQTGHTFSVTLPSLEDARKMQIMLDLQWACIKIASMSGAADNPIFLLDDDDDGGDFTADEVASWRDVGEASDRFGA